MKQITNNSNQIKKLIGYYIIAVCSIIFPIVVSGQEGDGCPPVVQNILAIFPAEKCSYIRNLIENGNAVNLELTELSKVEFERLCKIPNNIRELKKRYPSVKCFIAFTQNNVMLYIYYEILGEDAPGQGKYITLDIAERKEWVDILKGNRFSADHWLKDKSDASMKERLKDLSNLAGKLSVKLGVAKIPADQVGWIPDSELKDAIAVMYPKGYSGTTKLTIGFNKELLRNTSPQVAINALVHEIFHKYQEEKIEEYQKALNEYNKGIYSPLNLLSKQIPNIKNWHEENYIYPFRDNNTDNSKTKYEKYQERLRNAQKALREVEKSKVDKNSTAYKDAKAEEEKAYADYANLAMERDARAKGAEVEVIVSLLSKFK
ncbi:MAG: hypothetical protein LBC98_06855 [Prevotellaceae bacterium]|jgi:hypothetical protein|nr:hypothetical protein [Prevotellaceae bacterium]